MRTETARVGRRGRRDDEKRGKEKEKGRETFKEGREKETKEKRRVNDENRTGSVDERDKREWNEEVSLRKGEKRTR